jgi:hypothetical protein
MELVWKDKEIDRHVQEYLSQMRTAITDGIVKVHFHVIRKDWVFKTEMFHGT